MNNSLKEKLIEIAQQRISGDDPSHDISHSLRVLVNTEVIAAQEGGDFDVLIPAAIFHDIVNYPKNHPRTKFHSQESADETAIILQSVAGYPKEKIDAVSYAISMHNSKEEPITIEARILQDADNMEVTGAIVVMRMFASAGIMGRPFYHPNDPWAERREIDGLRWTVDYYLGRLLEIEEKMHTSVGKRIAQRRNVFLRQFFEELKIELKGE